MLRIFGAVMIRRCKMALTAINEAGMPPLLDMLLPLGSRDPSILHGLLAISMRASERSPQDLQHHQVALSQLHAELRLSQMDEKGDSGQIHRLLSLSLLLCIFTLHQCDGTWAQHTRGMVGLVRSVEQSSLIQTPLGRFLVGVSCFQDLSALALGRDRLSQKAWLSWMSPHINRRPVGTLTALEITTGYPESLLDIIARISELAEDNFYRDLQKTLYDSANDSRIVSNTNFSATSEDIEAALMNWTPPTLPASMSSFQQLALRTAWQIFRKACLLFHWKGHGFHSNLLVSVRADRSEKAASYSAEILADIGAIVELGRLHNLSIGNAMLWPIAIIAGEFIHGPEQSQTDILRIIDDISLLYYMEHPKQLAHVLRNIWAQASMPSVTYLSVEQVVNELKLTIPLF
ncbi:hypothetical protein DL98DRAFT_658191 [Cadophora sp. DSE1049]|nr:hypothetical protein DL98DRAFT_658191 [Cadophora sp. DSE1049]